MGYGLNTEQFMRQYLDSLKEKPEKFFIACEQNARMKGLSSETFQRLHKTLGCSIELKEVKADTMDETPYSRELKERGGSYFRLACIKHEVESRTFEQEATETGTV